MLPRCCKWPLSSIFFVATFIHRPFARWRHLTTTNRILFSFFLGNNKRLNSEETLRFHVSTAGKKKNVNNFPVLVSLAAVFSIVTQRSSPQEERCVTILKTAARETIPVHDCTQEQNFGLSLFFHRSTMEMAVTFKKDNFATMVMRRHTSPPLY